MFSFPFSFTFFLHSSFFPFSPLYLSFFSLSPSRPFLLFRVSMKLVFTIPTELCHRHISLARCSIFKCCGITKGNKNPVGTEAYKTRQPPTLLVERGRRKELSWKKPNLREGKEKGSKVNKIYNKNCCCRISLRGECEMQQLL